MKLVRTWMAPALLALGMAGALPASAAQYNWACYTYLPSSTDPAYKLLVNFANDIGKATDGKVSITCHVGGSLPIKSSSIPSAIRDNVLQFGLTDSGSYNGFIPLAGLLSLPGLYRNDSDLNKAIRLLTPVLDAQLKSRDVKLLGISYYPTQVLWSTKKLTNLSELKGRKIRVTTAEQAEFAKRMGAIPVTIDTPEVSTALQRGIVSAVLTASSGGGRIWHDLLKYNLRVGVNYVPVIFIANAKDFEKLPPAMRAKIVALGQRAATGLTQLLGKNEGTLTKSFAQHGMVITPGTAADASKIADIMRSYWPKWAKARGPEAEKELHALQTELAAH